MGASKVRRKPEQMRGKLAASDCLVVRRTSKPGRYFNWFSKKFANTLELFNEAHINLAFVASALAFKFFG
jgi:hypothetical protein